MKRLIIIMAFSLFGLFSCKGQNNLTVKEFESMLAADSTAQLLDVRTPEEFAEASAVLEELGFKTFNLLDGIKAWIEAGNVKVKVSTPLSPSSRSTLQ